MAVRGVRGATTVAEDRAELVWQATRALLEEMTRANDLVPQDLAAAYFTVTPDLVSAFPARAARDMGWQWVPLMDALEIPVAGSLPRCIRALLLWNTDRPQSAITHVYHGEAISLRPDLASHKEEKQ